MIIFGGGRSQGLVRVPFDYDDDNGDNKNAFISNVQNLVWLWTMGITSSKNISVWEQNHETYIGDQKGWGTS